LRPSCGAAPAARAAASGRLASDQPSHERGSRKWACGREEGGGSGPRERGIPEAEAEVAACASGRDRESEREGFGVGRLAQHEGKRRGGHTWWALVAGEDEPKGAAARPAVAARKGG